MQRFLLGVKYEFFSICFLQMNFYIKYLKQLFLETHSLCEDVRKLTLCTLVDQTFDHSMQKLLPL